jgi:hypothetical protein
LGCAEVIQVDIFGNVPLRTVVPVVKAPVLALMLKTKTLSDS